MTNKRAILLIAAACLGTILSGGVHYGFGIPYGGWVDAVTVVLGAIALFFVFRLKRKN